MTHKFAEIMFTDSVKTVQDRYSTRAQNERFSRLGGPNDVLGEREATFIQARDSFYLATVSETGWPYVQFRGGPRGFLKVIDGKTLGYADFRGNTQYISMGNLTRNDRVALFFMDYPRRTRLKLLGHARFEDVTSNPELASRLEVPTYRARVERAVLITLEAFDWNCPQHITPRYTKEEIDALLVPMIREIEELKARIAELQKNALEPRSVIDET
jgi:predicted pyridoxine 5'-phosphate oxidase superfamily flavin-nucleotide-binding protein